ncbi:MAG TPA: isoleucine--tRNA ligase [Acidimicrobiia bacterium]|nr:isoleucine--tRNA ligase [Acidimicrobiia bacterium]
MPFDPVPAFDLVRLEENVLAQWRERDVFAEGLRRREGAPEWVFYEGPPTANGRPGIHHVWARTFKDVYPRFQTMRGHYVARKAGWDCHGLPVEIEVEKELGFTNKHDIEEFGIAAFNQRCRESVFRYVEDWSALTTRIGMWLDTAHAYWTLTNEYIESVWWQFKQIWDTGDVYEGNKVVPYCGRCGTALSSHELGQPDVYQDVTERSVYVRFPVAGRDFDLLVWTTTPWTLVSNVAAAVGPGVEYVRVRGEGGARDVVLASARVHDVIGDAAEVMGTVAVDDLVGLRYQRPFDLLPLSTDDTPRVVADEFVTIDEGSGIVHLAPAFGEIDREVAAREGLPMLNPVGPAAAFVDTPYAGQFVKDADRALIDVLERTGRLFAVVDHTHSYPHCWRCGTPLIYWAKPEWFARTTAHKAELLRENEGIGWHPDYIKHGRFGDWLENNVDWALSRDRYWGTPLPIWRCRDCGADTCVGSVAELEELAGRPLADLDLHRPAVDDVVVDCPKCNGGRATRVEPVLDVWFDSGAMPAAQFHYPFENGELFERRFPADFICEAIDQTRGWFYSLLAINTLVFGQTPYRDVVCLALLLNSEGQRMSKSRGTVIDPWTILESQGADALRWNFLSSSSPWTPKRVSREGIDESTRVLMTLWQTYKFFVTYANLDGWEPGADAGASGTVHVLDRWIRSRLDDTVRRVTRSLDDFDALRAAESVEAFVDDLSNWYVRRSRARFWNADGHHDAAAHATLHAALETVARLLAPMTPFLADALYQNLARTEESVHLVDWPSTDDAAVDTDLESEMARARTIVSLGLSARMEAKLKVRQPLSRALVLLPGGARFSDDVAREVADELNVKHLEMVTSLEGLLDYSVVPNFRTLGPKVGKRVPLVKDSLARVDGATVQRALDARGRFELALDDGTTVELTAADVEVRAQSHEELALAQGDGYAIALDTTLDDELRAEGIARDLIRAINDLRKDRDFDIADRVHVRVVARDRVHAAAHEHRDRIAREVLAVTFAVEGDALAPEATTTIDGVPVALEVTRA